MNRFINELIEGLINWLIIKILTLLVDRLISNELEPIIYWLCCINQLIDHLRFDKFLRNGLIINKLIAKVRRMPQLRKGLFLHIYLTENMKHRCTPPSCIYVSQFYSSNSNWINIKWKLINWFVLCLFLNCFWSFGGKFNITFLTF